MLVAPSAPDQPYWIDALLSDAEHAAGPDGPEPPPPEPPPPADAPSEPREGERWWDDPRTERIAGRVFRGGEYLWTCAILSAVGAVALGQTFGPTAQPWGWAGGLLIGLIGYPLGWIKPPFTEDKNWKNREAERRKRRSIVDAEERMHWWAWGLLIGFGLVLVGLLAATVLGSVALSPLAPAGWSAEASAWDLRLGVGASD